MGITTEELNHCFLQTAGVKFSSNELCVAVIATIFFTFFNEFNVCEWKKTRHAIDLTFPLSSQVHGCDQNVVSHL
jgi:hypothetical protein